MIKGYIGTYDTPNTKGIYQFNFDECLFVNVVRGKNTKKVQKIFSSG